jgi:hypothetical protein
MSVIAHRKNAEISDAARQAEDAPIATVALTIFRSLRKATIGVARVVVWAAQAIAEGRQRRADIEIEFYRNRYMHSSKNSDGLSIVRRAQ